MNLPDPSSTSPAREQQYSEYVVLLSRHDQSLRRFVRSIMPSRDGVDDVVQETALECWKKYSEFNPSDNESTSEEFLRWSCVIARFKALSWQRDAARSRLVFRESVIELLAENSMDALEHRQDEQEALESCLEKLPDEQRRLVLSVHAPGESIARIAKETGVKARSLYSKVNTLRTLLFECVRRQLAQETNNG
ncbi:MAG: sigma-70 family RNA polymerase sigma factor [Planctomycetota bacterium]